MRAPTWRIRPCSIHAAAAHGVGFGQKIPLAARLVRLRSNTRSARSYVAKFEEAIYILHCFQKKTALTSRRDKDIVDARYRAVVHGRSVKK
jgi:hypothetical protein